MAHDMIVIGTSAGGVSALEAVVSRLPKDMPASIFAVMHLASGAPSVLPKIISRVSVLPVSHPDDGEDIELGHVYIAPPDRHMTLEPGRIRLNFGPKENNSRPAIDPLFSSAARNYKERVVGVILTGQLDDGTAGMIDVHRHGGKGIVQDPEESPFSGMPASAIQYDHVDYVLRLAEIPGKLVELLSEPVVPTAKIVEEKTDMDTEVTENDKLYFERTGSAQRTSILTCPDCGGVLWEFMDDKVIRYRCHVGHGYTAEGLAAEQGNTLENALWSAVRILEERESFLKRLARRYRERGQDGLADRYEKQAFETRMESDVIRGSVSRISASVPEAA